MAFHFRDIEHNLCIALDQHMPTILCPGEENGANAAICYGYVDKQAGLTFEVLCLASYVDGDYTIVNENKSVSMKVRAGNYENTTIIPIKNAAIMKRFEDRIKIIEDGYYCGDAVEESRLNTSLDPFRHPFFPDDVEGILAVQGLQPERIWARITRYMTTANDVEFFVGSLLNTPFDAGYHLNEGDEIIIGIVKDGNQTGCMIVPKQ